MSQGCPDDEELQMIEHNMTVEEVALTYRTLIDTDSPEKSYGLNSDEICERRFVYGLNAITPSAKVTYFRQFLGQLLGLFNLLLVTGGALSFVLFAIDPKIQVNLFLGIILVFVAIINAGIDFYQQYRTAALLESFMSLVPSYAMVIREGTLVKIMATDVVPGDILYIQNGDRVAADLRLIGSTDLRVDNSSISGEGESLPRNCDTCLGKSYMEAENLLFSGTNIMAGDGYGIIIRTGDHSVFGQIARLTIGEKTPESQLSIEIKVFVRKIAAVAILTAFVFLGLCLWMGYPFPITFSFAIGIFVSYVPQGLPVTVSTLLTIAAKRMAKKNVLVKSLHAVETLGSITLLATDKTGTLTQNRMSVVGAWCWGAFFMIEDDLPENNDELKLKIELLIKAAGLCTHARFEDSDPAILIWNRKIIGDATEVGLLRFAARYSNISKVQAENQKIYEIAFTSENKWHMIVHRSSSEMTKMDCDTAYLKGAPERVLEMCAYCMNRDGERIVMNFDQKNEIEQAYLKFASQGRRVIAFAQQIVILSEEHDWSQDRNHVSMCDFTFIGLLSIMDPPKRGVSTAIKECREAGVQVVMVTGDHPVTAEAIAIDIGIITTDYHSNRMSTSTDYKVDNGDQSNGNHEFAQSIESEDSKMDRFTGNKENEGHVVVHGDSIEGLTDSDWKNILNKREVIFARTTPHQKLEIVTRFQDAGHIVGVSGDGVNDAAALKRADLGISMNRSASDVSKEAAAMILLDDNFCSIVSGIAEGRLIFANLKKSIRYTITHTMGEVLPFIAFIVLGIPLPINSMLLLVVDLGSELGPAISFAYEPAETGLMTRSASDLGSEHYMASSPNAIKEQNSSEGNVKIAEKSFGNRLTQKWPFKKKSKRGEVLVDTEMLVWAFLQGGIIMSAGAFAAYLTSLYVTGVDLRGIMNSTQYWQVNSPALRLVTGKIVDGTEQVRILGKAQSSYYAAIVIFQLFNLWITKRSRLLPFGRDMFKNKWTFVGAAVAIVAASIVVYVPYVNTVIFGGGPAPFLALVAPIIAGLFLVIYETIRRIIFYRSTGRESKLACHSPGPSCE